MSKSVIGHDYIKLFKKLTNFSNGELDIEMSEYLLENYRIFKAIKFFIDDIPTKNISKASLDSSGAITFKIKFHTEKEKNNFMENDYVKYNGTTYNIHYEEIKNNSLLIYFK